MRALSGLVVLLALSSPAAGTDSGCPLGGASDPRERVPRAVVERWAATRGRIRAVTSETAYCSGCHDATIAPSVRARPAMSVDFLSTHSNDVPYPDGRRGYRISFSLDPRLVLEDGRITCRTCHGGSDRASRYLSMPVGELCLACHQM